ncbi:Secreted protein OS=Streptomyces microflavus OX=1919 GN=Smic_24820 PE=4 SV=1 [Streptomyces microflavus]
MTQGQESLDVLNNARMNSLKARANENLTLVARGAVLTADGSADQYETDYTTGMKALKAQLKQAGQLADDRSGSAPVAEAAEERHRVAGAPPQGACHGRPGRLRRCAEADHRRRGLHGAVLPAGGHRAAERAAHEQGEFTSAAEDGRGALRGLPTGAAALAVLGAVAAILGVNRRLRSTGERGSDDQGENGDTAPPGAGRAAQAGAV